MEAHEDNPARLPEGASSGRKGASPAPGARTRDHSPELARLARACANNIRAEILLLLARAPGSTSELARATELELAHVSHHLSVLREAGLIASETQGRMHVHRLAKGATGAGEILLDGKGVEIVIRIANERGPAAAPEQRGRSP